MYMLAGLRALFLKALNSDLNNNHYAKLALIEQWNKECDKVFEYKNEIIRETYYKTTPKVGTWEKSGYKWKCSSCGSKVNIDGTPLENGLIYCSHCGSKMEE